MRPARSSRRALYSDNKTAGRPMLYSLRLSITDESGATAIEYALIAGMIALVIITAVGLVGSEVLGIFTQLETLL